MKGRLKKYKTFIIPVILLIGAIVLYFTANYLVSGILVIIANIILTLQIITIKNNSLITNLSSGINHGIEENLLNYDIPVVLINKNGNIIWSNKRFEIVGKILPIGSNIISIIRELDLQRLLKCDKDLYQRVALGGGQYKVTASYIDIKINEENNGAYILYFNDISKIEDHYLNSESVILMEVDNLFEALESAEEASRPLIIADIETTINSYAQKLRGFIVKYENNKYCLVVQDKYIENEINEKFKILETISKINRGNKYEITLSIGIGKGGASPQENYQFAVSAKELALGRGGDQVAIKDNGQLRFFGGNSRELEKRTRVRARIVARAIKEIIYESSNIFIIGHKNIDMDCFGSAVGLSSIIRKLGKKCNIVLDTDIEDIRYFYNKLRETGEYDNLFISSEQAKKIMNPNTLVIIVDVHNRSYISCRDIVEQASKKIIIDHHRRSPDILQGTLLSYIEVYASSTSELVTELIQYISEKQKLSSIEAEGLLAGIFMDTKGFSFKTGVRTFDAASYLRSLGADTIEVKKMFTDDLHEYLIIADTIKSAEVNDGIAIAVSPKVKEVSMVARAADELLNISGINVCFVLADMGDGITISGRSLGDFNVQIILEELGGGGHMNMAGAKVIDSTIEETKNKLKKSINKHLRAGE